MNASNLAYYQIFRSTTTQRMLTLCLALNLLICPMLASAAASTSSSSGSGSSSSSTSSGSSGSGSGSGSGTGSGSSSSSSTGSMALTNPYPIRTLIGNIYFRLLQHRKPIMIVPPILRLMYQYRKPLITALNSFSSAFGFSGLGFGGGSGFASKGSQNDRVYSNDAAIATEAPSFVGTAAQNLLFNQLFGGGAGFGGAGGANAAFGPGPNQFARYGGGGVPGGVGVGGDRIGMNELDLGNGGRFQYPPQY